MADGAGLNERDEAPAARLSPAMASRRLLILVFVRDYIQRNRGSPSLREISNATGVSVVGVTRHLVKLVDAGELLRTPGPRGLRLPTMRDAALRLLREHGFLVDEDLLRIDRARGGTEKQLLPPPTLTYRRPLKRESGDGDQDHERG
jgi:hypothetical protein